MMSLECLDVWYIKVFVLSATTFAAFFIFLYAISILKKLFHSKVIKNLLSLATPPILMLIVGLGIDSILSTVIETFKYKKNLFITNLFTEILLIALAWFAFRSIDMFEKHCSMMQNKKVDETTISALAKAIKIIIATIIGLILMESFGISTQGLVAFGGVSGIVMGFASKDVLANIMGAITIYLDQPFKIGDWIRITEKDIDGYILNIGIRCTVIETLDKRPLYVPNAIFGQAVIENASRMTHRKIDLTFRISHEDIEKIKDLTYSIESALLQNNFVDPNQTCKAIFDSSDQIGLVIRVLCFSNEIEMPKYLNVKHDLLLFCHNIAIKNGCSLPHYNEHFYLHQ